MDICNVGCDKILNRLRLSRSRSASCGDRWVNEVNDLTLIEHQVDLFVVLLFHFIKLRH